MSDPAIESAAKVAELRKQAAQQPTSAEFIEVLSSMGYSFRFNELTQAVEVNGTPINDVTAATIRTAMRDAGYKGMTAIEDAYIAHAVSNSYHPIRDYFDSLQWDGGDHIARLAQHFTDSRPVFADGRTWFYHAFRRWLIGYVARVFDHVQLPMLVFESAQRKGKSYFVRWLASILADYFIEGPIDPDDKDCLLRLASSFIWEVPELGATVRKSNIEALRSFVTLNTVTVRRPYAKFDLHLPAVAGLIGTINDSGGFLNDSTGTRRALVIPITSIDWQYSQTVNVIQVWAEAVAAYQAGEASELTADERETQAQVNADFETPDPVDDLLNDKFQIDAARTEWFTSAADILATVDATLRGNSVPHSWAIASALKRRGIVQRRPYVNGVRTRGYPGVMRRSG
jgi:predicted P-loop ATPase